MNEDQLAIQKAELCFGEYDKHMLNCNKALELSESVKTTGINRGLMLSFESKRYDEQAPLGMPVNSFTESYSMTNVEYAIESFIDRAAKAFKKAMDAAEKGIKYVLDVIMRIIARFKGEKKDVDEDAKVSDEKLYEALSEYADECVLNRWICESAYNSSHLIACIVRMIDDVLLFTSNCEVVIDTMKVLVDKGTVLDIQSGSADISTFRPTYNIALEKATELGSIMNNREVFKSSIVEKVIEQLGGSDLLVKDKSSSVYTVFSKVLGNATIDAPKGDFDSKDINIDAIMESSKRVRKESDKLRDDVKDSEKKILARTTLSDIDNVVTISSKLDDGVNGLKEYGEMIRTLSGKFSKARYQSVNSILAMINSVNVIQVTIEDAAFYIESHSKDYNKVS